MTHSACPHDPLVTRQTIQTIIERRQLDDPEHLDVLGIECHLANWMEQRILQTLGKMAYTCGPLDRSVCAGLSNEIRETVAVAVDSLGEAYRDFLSDFLPPEDDVSFATEENVEPDATES